MTNNGVAVLDPALVEKIFLDCLYQEGESTKGQVLVEGIMSRYGLNPERLESHKEVICQLLDELPFGFREMGGGGASFLRACCDKHGNLWTGQHSVMEQLFMLGIAIEKVEYLVPRRIWGALPGGVPYLVVKE